ncbi:MAG: hypothetical protein SGPRY_004336 [Prymnesium sp.]
MPCGSLAVCLVGFVRTLGWRGVHSSLAHALRGASSTDFFGVVSLGGHETDTAKGQWAAVTRESLEPALSLLRPVAWEDDTPVRSGPPLCHLACMRQFERLERCGLLIQRAELACGRRYNTVVKARPDIAFFGRNEPSLRNDTLYKDTAAGDMLVYVPRAQFDNLTWLLSSGLVGTPSDCSALHPKVRCDANGTVRLRPALMAS